MPGESATAKLQLPRDFKEFLKSLNSNNVEYLLIGGYAVTIHGYVRMTNDIDVWVRATPGNAERVVRALVEFGFGRAAVDPHLFLKPNSIVRIKAAAGRMKDLADLENLPR